MNKQASNAPPHLQEESGKTEAEESRRRKEALPLGEKGEGIEGAFSMLIVLTKDGKRLVRPIGGGWENGINDAIRQMDKEFPGCRMKILREDYGGWCECFEPNGAGKERVLGIPPGYFDKVDKSLFGAKAQQCL